MLIFCVCFFCLRTASFTGYPGLKYFSRCFFLEGFLFYPGFQAINSVSHWLVPPGLQHRSTQLRITHLQHGKTRHSKKNVTLEKTKNMDKKVLVEGMRRQNGDFVCARKSEKQIKTYGQTGKKRISLLQAGMKKLLQVTSIQRCFRKKKYILYIYTINQNPS